MRRALSFKQPAIEPAPVAKCKPWDLRLGCPKCGFHPIVGILDEGLEEEVGAYCSGCNTQFKIESVQEIPMFPDGLGQW